MGIVSGRSVLEFEIFRERGSRLRKIVGGRRWAGAGVGVLEMQI